MGKIRVKGLEEMTPEQEAKEKAKKEAKKAEKIAAKNAQRAAEGKKVNPQTEAIVNDATTAVETSAEEVVTPTPQETVETTEEAPKKKKKEKFVKVHKKVESKRHKENQTLVSKNQSYNITQGLEALRKFKTSKFDETVELHINTKEKGVNGQVILPHGTGKTLVIKIADDAIIAEVAKGKINFDVLVAVPSMMPQLARIAKVLGPRGLMPNPKNGTITDKPEEAVKKLSGGQVNYKTESSAPIIHAIVGKVSFDDKKLEENIKTFIGSVGMANINSVTLKSTMSPAIRLIVN